MGRIALLVPREDMLCLAHNILQEKTLKLQEIRVIRTENAVEEARRAAENGASILIARGLQASLIRQDTDLPVVEIVMTAQEMALLIMRAKQIVKKPRPVIAVVGFRNMFCDMSYFDELYGIELRTYFAEQGDELADAANQAVEDGADLIIGGDTAVGTAAGAGVPSLFLSVTEDSMRQAFDMAERMEQAMDAEKRASAQMETLFDNSFNGVIRLDSNGIVTAVNPRAEDMAGRKKEEIIGRPVGELIPEIGEDLLERVFREGKDSSLFFRWNHSPVLAVLAPVICKERVEEALITCYRTHGRRDTEDDGQKKKASGPFALVSLDDILQNSPAMRECVRIAGLYALSDHPVVIIGEPGTEKRMLAEGMHNRSGRGIDPFLSVCCRGLSGEEQRELIFGSRGALVRAKRGSLFLEDAEELTEDNQRRLYELLRYKTWDVAGEDRPRRSDAWILTTMERPVYRLMKEGRLLPELAYLLGGLELSVPPLRMRKEDLLEKLDASIKISCERCGRYHVLTKGAWDVLADYPWPGNHLQVESFCERLILPAGKRSIDETAVRRLLEELYPEDGPEEHEMEQKEIPEPREAARIREALALCGGNREETARELGISKATLWRRIKKYGIEI